MALILIGIGLGEIEDLTESGIEIINMCCKVYIFDSKYYLYNKKELESYLSCKLAVIQSRTFEEEVMTVATEIKESSYINSVGILMPGNPFCDDLYPKIKCTCQSMNIELKIVHNICYMNAMGNTGIQLYKFGETILMDSYSDEEIAESLKTIQSNLRRNLNTLIVFNRFVPNLASKTITKLCKSEWEDKILYTSSKFVILYRESNSRYFEYGQFPDICDLQVKNVEALSICFEFDCVEEEYLREMKVYQGGNTCRNEEYGSFSIIGLGLGRPKDITLRGRKLISSSRTVFLEGYTSIMLGGKEAVEAYFQKEVTVADRDMVEQESDKILDPLREGDVSFLVVGDPLGATTHTDILLRSLKNASKIHFANNTSIFNALGLSGLKTRKFGATISIPFWTDNYRPDSFFDRICANIDAGCHTLCLLDIQVKEQSFQNLARGRKIYEKPRYMSVPVAAKQLLECKSQRLERNEYVSIGESTKTICLARIGTDTEEISFALLGHLPGMDLGGPLHSLIIIGRLDAEERP